MIDHDTCEKGVSYGAFAGLAFDQKPCFERNGPGTAPSGCPLADFLSPDERLTRDEEMKKRFAHTFIARAAIEKHLGGPWKQGMAGASGVIDCPVCGNQQSLRFSRSGYNGHIHAGCEKEGCVRWSE